MAVILLVARPSLLFSQAGQSGFAFLKLGLSARGVAMGDAMSAAATGAAATDYNPAGLLRAPGESNDVEIMFMHKEWIQDTRMEFLGAAVPLDDDNALGAGIATTTVSGIEVRLRPGPADGTFTARELAAGLSFARRITPEVRLGVTAKFLYQKIYVDDASGFALDAGGVWQTPLENLTVGGMVANLGTMSNLKDVKTSLPALLRIGPAYRFSFNEGSMGVLGAADVMRVFPESKNYLNTGGEITFNKLVAARVGYQFGSEGRGLSAGLGLRYGRFTLDYAFAKLSSELGDGHTLSLALSL
jgi:hypothetical protein